MRENKRTASAINQFETRENKFDEILSWKCHRNKVLGRAVWRARNRIRFHNHSAMVLVVLKHRICDGGELVAIVNIAIHIHRHHFRPFLQVLLLCRRELVLIFSVQRWK